ncbi:MAG: GAF domain-containing sensor histidine kinase [Elusimicrobia bacterium]|nr:GAF domain-containing sensor histidine kinase [Elusimicrobiota bacterium]
MIELTPVEFGICLGLTAAVFAFAAYWYMRFFRVLGLEGRAKRARVEASELKAFATEVMDLGVAGNTSQAINEFGRRVLEALHKRVPGTQLWWIARQQGVGDPMVSRRGGAYGGASSTRLDERLFEDAVSQEGLFDLSWASPRTDREGRAHTIQSNGQGNSFLRHLGAMGLRRVRVVSWGKPDATNGILALGDGGSAALDAADPFMEIVKSHATALAAIVDELARLSRTREKLEGGLSLTIEDLTSTHMRLIEKTRKIRALEEVASTISGSGGPVGPESHRASAPQAGPGSALSAIVSIVARFLEADLVAVLLLDESTGELVVHPGSYGIEGNDMFYRVPLSEERSSSARVFKTGKGFVSGDAQNDPQVLPAHAKAWGVESLMVVPLAVEGRSLGVMRVGKRGRDSFGHDDLQGLQVIAREAAVIVETAMLNRKLSQAAEQLIALNRMKDDFVSTVSHEFKTPLTSILGFLTVVMDGEAGDLTEQQSRFLGIARTAARRLTGLVSDLLDLSRLEGGIRMDLQNFAMDKLLASCAENYQHQFADCRKTLTVAVPGRLPMVLGDERWVTLAVDNLLSNALKFTKPGGKVRLWAADKGEFVMVGVADDGIGVPPEEKERVFEKFYRASNRSDVQAPGTGLGLAIVKEIVSKHGGKIWLECEPGKETTFCFVLRTAPRD